MMLCTNCEKFIVSSKYEIRIDPLGLFIDNRITVAYISDLKITKYIYRCKEMINYRKKEFYL
jgi:hypothetical protein